MRAMKEGRGREMEGGVAKLQHSRKTNHHHQSPLPPSLDVIQPSYPISITCHPYTSNMRHFESCTWIFCFVFSYLLRRGKGKRGKGEKGERNVRQRDMSCLGLGFFAFISVEGGGREGGGKRRKRRE